MKWCLPITIIIIALMKKSEESCELFKKSVTVYRIERVLYRYVTCTKMTPNDDVNSQILTALNSSSQYLEITNSHLPDIGKEMFRSLNLTQITIAAGVQIIQEKTFERVNVSTIILENNSIRQIKDNAFKSFAIYFINLQDNALTRIDARAFSGAANLRKLNLQNNSISNIDLDAFKELGNLEELKLSFNKINALPSRLFWPLFSLQTVYFNNNSMTEIESSFLIKNKLLQFLNVNDNNLARLDATYFPRSLTEIYAERNDIGEFNVSNLIHLNTLVLNDNKISKLINSLDNLPRLNFLHVSDNQLTRTGAFDAHTFSGLKNLSLIELDNNRINDFDTKWIENVEALEGISLVGNYLTKLYLTESMTNIKYFNVSFNYITEIKNLSKLPNLLKLQLSHNNLTDIDFDMFTGLNQLHSLWLNNNFINKLTLGCFRNLKYLISLDISNNNITDISAGTLNGLDSVIDLNLSHNRIAYLNEDIFHNLKNLKFLNIAHNILSTVNIKGILSHVIWLREIDMNGNNWTCKLLINISRDNKLLKLIGGSFYNVSNVYGIPCRENVDREEGKLYLNYEENFPDVIASLNANVINTRDISVKLSFIIALMILFFVCIVAKIFLTKYFQQIKIATQFSYQKSKSETEIHLI